MRNMKFSRKLFAELFCCWFILMFVFAANTVANGSTTPTAKPIAYVLKSKENCMIHEPMFNFEDQAMVIKFNSSAADLKVSYHRISITSCCNETNVDICNLNLNNYTSGHCKLMGNSKDGYRIIVNNAIKYQRCQAVRATFGLNPYCTEETEIAETLTQDRTVEVKPAKELHVLGTYTTVSEIVVPTGISAYKTKTSKTPEYEHSTGKNTKLSSSGTVRKISSALMFVMPILLFR